MDELERIMKAKQPVRVQHTLKLHKASQDATHEAGRMQVNGLFIV